MQSDSNTQHHVKVVSNIEHTPESAEAQTTNEESRVAEMTKIDASKINHKVFKVRNVEVTSEDKRGRVEQD